eukprot:scaffold10289_cov75-Skeletonema_marinoi.AAC.2
MGTTPTSNIIITRQYPHKIIMSTPNTNAKAAANKPRDEVKKEALERKFIENLRENTETFLSMMLHDAKLWDHADNIIIRDKISEISRKPSKYPPPLTSWGVERDQLTKDVSDQLKNREMDRPNNNDIYLQITHADCEKRKEHVGIDDLSHDIGTRQRWKFTAVDGDGNAFLFRIDSTLNIAGMTLTPGTIAKVSSSFPVYFAYDNAKDDRCAVVARKFDIVGKQPIPDDLLAGKNNKKAIKAKTIKKRKEHPTNNTSTTQPPTKPTCNGLLCSQHGVAFDLCLSTVIPPNTAPLAIVARDCVFATMDVKDMMNNHKRFLLYYYYATTIYQFHGAGNRVDLPECIIFAIRNLYPRDTVDVANSNE